MKRTKMILLGFLSIVFVQLLTSCCKTVECGPFVTTFFNVANFTKEESDTIIIRTYKTGTNFTEKIDSLLVARDKNAKYEDLPYGSTFITINKSANYHISSQYDFEFYFPATNTLRRISEWNEEQGTMKYCEPAFQQKTCTDMFVSVKMDGVVYSHFPELSK